MAARYLERNEGLNSIVQMKIPSIAERRKPEVYSEKRLGLQSERDKVQQEKAYKYPFALIPATADYGYPNSIQNISVNMDNFVINKIFDSIITEYNTGYLYTKASFTKFIVEYDFNVLIAPSTEETEGAALASGFEMDLEFECLKKGLRDNKILIGEQAKLSLDKVGFMFRVTGDYIQDRNCLTLAIKGENPPICILTDPDEHIKPTNDTIPSFMTVYVIKVKDMKDKIEDYINVNRLSEEFRNSQYRDSVLYYWSRNIINPGHVYWLFEENETLYLYDLTSSLKMKPLEWNRDGGIMWRYKREAIRNSLALLYFYCMKKLYYKDMTTYYSEVIELGERSIACMDRYEYPIEFCQANILLSNTLIPIGTNIDDPQVMISIEGCPNVMKRVTNNEDAFLELKVVTNMSVSFLQRALELLSLQMREKNLLPLAEGNVPHGSSPSDFDFNHLLNLLGKDNIEDFDQENYENTVMKPFMARSDLELKLVVVILRKLFHDCIIDARMNQMRVNYSLVAMRCDLALTSWIALGAILTRHAKPKKTFPLPIRPLYLYGEIFYSLVRKAERRVPFFRNYKDPEEQTALRTISNMVSVTDVRCLRDFQYNYDNSQFLIASFNSLAASVLFAAITPERMLLERFCVVANHIAYDLIGRNKGLLYKNLRDAQSNLRLSERLIDVAVHYSTRFFGHSRQVYFAALWIKAYYWRADVDYSIVQRGEIYDRVDEDYNKAFTIYQKLSITAAQKQAKIDIPVGEDVNRTEYLDTIVEKIWRLKQWEDQDNKSYHKKILPLFEKYINECKKAIPSSGRTIYFQYRCAVGCASLAEYLLGLYRDSKAENIRDQAEHWFLQATERFNSVVDDFEENPSTRDCPLEILKTISDRITLYEFATVGIRRASKYDEKTMKALMQIYDTLLTLMQYQWHERNADEDEERKRIAYFGVLKAVEKRMQNCLMRRRQLIDDEITLDIPSNRIRELLLASMNMNRMPLYSNVITVLNEIKVILASFGLA